MASLVSLAGIEELLTRHAGKEGTLRSRFLLAIRARYSEDQQQELPAIATDDLIALLWNVQSADEIRAKRKAFSSLKSATNKFLKELVDQGENPESIIVSRDNTFTISEERKDTLIQKVGLGPDSSKSMLDMFSAFNSLVKEMLEQQGQQQAQGILDQLDKTRSLIQSLAGKTAAISDLDGIPPSQQADHPTAMESIAATAESSAGPETGLGGEEAGTGLGLGLDAGTGAGTLAEEEDLPTEETELVEIAEDEFAESDLFDDGFGPQPPPGPETGPGAVEAGAGLGLGPDAGTGEGASALDVLPAEGTELVEIAEEEFAESDLLDDGFGPQPPPGPETGPGAEDAGAELGLGPDAGTGDGASALDVLPAEETELIEIAEEEFTESDLLDEGFGPQPPPGPETGPGAEEAGAGLGLGPDAGTGEGTLAEEELAAEETELVEIAEEEFTESELLDVAELSELSEIIEDTEQVEEIEEIEEIEEVLEESTGFDQETEAGDGLESKSGSAGSAANLPQEPPARPRLFDVLSRYLDPDETLTDSHEVLLEPREEYIAQILERFTPKFITIPAGEYLIGSRYPKGLEIPLQKSSVNRFHIGQYPITNDLFELFVRDTGYETDAEKAGYGHVFEARCMSRTDALTGRSTFSISKGISGHKVLGANWRHPTGPAGSLTNKHNHPVVQVSRRDAMAFAAWAGKRLPSEEEWEAAARGRDGRLFPWGNTWQENMCNLETSGIGDTSAVDQFGKGTASPYSIFDLLGNVHEWTKTIFQQPASSSGIMDRNLVYILKGGCWTMRGPITLSARHIEKENYWSNTIGFRCVA